MADSLKRLNARIYLGFGSSKSELKFHRELSASLRGSSFWAVGNRQSTCRGGVSPSREGLKMKLQLRGSSFWAVGNRQSTCRGGVSPSREGLKMKLQFLSSPSSPSPPSQSVKLSAKSSTLKGVCASLYTRTKPRFFQKTGVLKQYLS